MPLSPGDMINENVRLLDMLGQGGMGSVWLADHLGLEAQVAVKFIDPELIKRYPSLRKRFKREASICARLRSIHAVQTFDHGEMEDDTPYIVMELLEGETLTDRVEEKGALEARDAAMIISQVAKVLHRAHVLSIVHRDIKPDNIFLTHDSDYDLFVKVLDFGIAKEQSTMRAKDSVTKTGAIVGTPEFMSPEQALSSKNIDHRSDVFSLAVVAFYALTGELPFDPDDETPLWLQMSQGDHASITEHKPDAPRELEAWFRHALAPKPEKRFQSARIMARAFGIAINPRGKQIVDELSSSDDSVSLPAAPVEPTGDDDSWPEAADLLAAASDPGASDPGASDPGASDPAASWEPAPHTQRMAEEAPAPSDSHPAQFELIGPDSEEYGEESTLLMDEDDHREAEVDEMEPTPRQPRPTSSAVRPGVYAAVRAGAYNAGESGAFNAMVTPPLRPEYASVPPTLDTRPMREVLATLPPQSRRSKSRVLGIVALSLVVIGLVGVALVRLGMG